jgi:hypothetical protein
VRLSSWLNPAMSVKRAMGIVAACVLAVICADGIASLPFADAYQTCMDGWYLDGQTWRAEVELSTQVLPYALHCSYANGVVETHGPGIGAWLAWVVAVATTLIATMHYRRIAAARGLAGSLAVLAAFGYLAQPLGMEIGGVLATLGGVPVVYGIDRGLRARPDRRLHSCLLAAVLPAIVLISWGMAWAWAQPTAGVLIAAVFGVATAALIERVERLEELLLRPARDGLAGPP